MKFPELVWLQILAPWMVVVESLVFYGLGGASAWLWGHAVPIFTSLQVVGLINSACHMVGESPHRLESNPACKATNVGWLSLILLGENLHNNHHVHSSLATTALRKGELDIAFWVIRLLEALRLVHDVRVPRAPELREAKVAQEA